MNKKCFDKAENKANWEKLKKYSKKWYVKNKQLTKKQLKAFYEFEYVSIMKSLPSISPKEFVERFYTKIEIKEMKNYWFNNKDKE